MSQPSCCHNCPNRHPACHDHCEKHHIEKLVNDLLAMEVRKKKLRQYAADAIIVNRIRKCQKVRRINKKFIRRLV